MKEIAGPVTSGLVATKFLGAIIRAIKSGILGQLCATIQMDEMSEKIAGIGAPASMSKFDGTSKLISLEEFEVDLATDRFQAGFTYDEATPNHRLWQIIQPKINELAVRATNHAIILLSTRIVAATGLICISGKNYYDDDHPVKGGTNDNLLAGTGITLAQVTADYWSAVAALQGMKDSEGEVLIRPDMALQVQCPPAMQSQFETLQNAIVISQTTNIVRRRYDLWVDQKLADANDWYLHITNEPTKPFVYGVFQKPKVKKYAIDQAKSIAIDADVIHGIAPGDYTCSVKTVN